MDRQFSFSKLDTALEVNARNTESREASQSGLFSNREATSTDQQSQNESHYMWPTENSWVDNQETDEWSQLIRAMNSDWNEDEMQALRRRKKKKGYSI